MSFALFVYVVTILVLVGSAVIVAMNGYFTMAVINRNRGVAIMWLAALLLIGAVLVGLNPVWFRGLHGIHFQNPIEVLK